MNDLEKAQSCITQVTQQEPYLTGEKVIIAVLDSGIDYFLPEFRSADGRTRILALWDQTQQPDEGRGRLPPPGYREGVLYTREMINEALALGRESGQSLVPVFDVSGHGTAVAGVAAGTNIGVAPRADLLIIKLGSPKADSFPRTTQLMRGINYAVNLGVELGSPLAVNLSFGNTYGDHQGNSLLERFIDNASEIGKSAVIVGSGNEGASGGHTAGVLQNDSRMVELAVGDYETGLSIQLWKNYQDMFDLAVISPGGERTVLELSDLRKAQAVRRTLEQTQLLWMEDHRSEFVVIVAGYTDLMEEFLSSNPGLKSRFNKFIHFGDYSAGELLAILESMCAKQEYVLSERAKARAMEILSRRVSNKPDNFANARDVRNFLERAIANHASRVVNEKDADRSLLSTLEAEDLEEFTS